jgi:hypothetical protein
VLATSTRCGAEGSGVHLYQIRPRCVDCLAPETNPAESARSDFSSLLRSLECRVLLELHGQVFQGLHHERDWYASTIYLLQHNNVDTLLAAFPCGARPVSRPVDNKVALCATTTHGKRKHPRLFNLCCTCDSLMYLASCGRPDSCSPF